MGFLSVLSFSLTFRDSHARTNCRASKIDARDKYRRGECRKCIIHLSACTMHKAGALEHQRKYETVGGTQAQKRIPRRRRLCRSRMGGRPSHGNRITGPETTRMDDGIRHLDRCHRAAVRDLLCVGI